AVTNSSVPWLVHNSVTASSSTPWILVFEPSSPHYAGCMTTVVQRLGSGRPVFSVEFCPPRDEDEERVLWRSARKLEPLDPAFVSVTYGAGGSTRDRTVRTTGRVARE